MELQGPPVDFVRITLLLYVAKQGLGRLQERPHPQYNNPPECVPPGSWASFNHQPYASEALAESSPSARRLLHTPQQTGTSALRLTSMALWASEHGHGPCPCCPLPQYATGPVLPSVPKRHSQVAKWQMGPISIFIS